MLRHAGRMGPDELGQLVHRVLAVEQGPDDAQPGLVAQELEHSHGGAELVLGRNYLYLRSHAGIIASWRWDGTAGSAGGIEALYQV